MDEIRKFDLSSSDENKKSSFNPENTQSAMSRRRKTNFARPKKTLIILLVVIFLLGIVSFLTIVLPAQKAYRSANKTYLQAKKAWDAVKKQNVELASSELAATKKELTQTQKDVQALSFTRFIPIVGGYYNDIDHLIKAGFHGLDATSILVESIKPYADVLGLKGQGSFVMGSAEQRIQTVVLTMGKITPRIDDISNSLISAKEEIDKVDSDHYPSLLGGEKVRKQLTSVQNIADQGVVIVDQARPLIKVLPSLLGESKEKKYLVLFQNDKELRPTGGFITAYAIFGIEKGIVHVNTSDDIYNLDNRISGKQKAPEPILKYLPKVYTFNLRDSNLSPDYVESMKTFRSMYESIPGATKVDGIIALDTHVLVSIIKILDDEVEAAGITFTTKEDSRCSCPQVIYVLEDNISRPVGYEKGGGRKDLLGALLYAIMEKALKSSPKLYWGPLFQDAFKKVNEKHVLFYLYDENAQKGAEALNASGKIHPFDGDYLHINNTNFAGAKSNLYVKESIDQNIQVGGDGTVTKTVTIIYKNPYPPSDCNLERGGLCLNATLRNWLRIYVPKGSKLVDSQGSEVKMTTYEELGKTVFEGFLTVRPKGSATFTITYKLPFKVDKGSPLPLLIQKQPGTGGNEYTLQVNGHKREQFELVVDKELKLKL